MVKEKKNNNNLVGSRARVRFEYSSQVQLELLSVLTSASSEVVSKYICKDSVFKKNIKSSISIIAL